MKRVLWSLLMILTLLLSGCGKTEPAGPEVPAAVLPGAAMPSAEASAEPSAEPGTESSAEAPAETRPMSAEMPAGAATAEPGGDLSAEPEISAVPAPTPEPTPVPFGSVPGTYTGDDGSELVVEADGTVKYTTEVSGRINGSPMAADLTFHGRVEGDGFLFDKVTYKGIDLTAIAAANGITDASPWQEAARQLYLAQQ